MSFPPSNGFGHSVIQTCSLNNAGWGTKWPPVWQDLPALGTRLFKIPRVLANVSSWADATVGRSALTFRSAVSSGRARRERLVARSEPTSWSQHTNVDHDPSRRAVDVWS